MGGGSFDVEYAALCGAGLAGDDPCCHGFHCGECDHDAGEWAGDVAVCRAGDGPCGASGLIFGYLGYLLLRGYFERSVGAIALSVLVGVAYGGMIWGVLPTTPGISWQGHLFGFVGGAISARFLAEPN